MVCVLNRGVYNCVGFLVVMLLIVVQVSGCTAKKTIRTTEEFLLDGKKGLFSWSSEVFEDSNTEHLFEIMGSQGLTTIYQHFKEKDSIEEIKKFIESAKENGISVYYLAGSPEWSLDSSGTKMCEVVERASKINKELPKGVRIEGVFMDTEPHLTEDWQEREKDVMNRYVQGMKKAHERATEEGLVYIACIPFYYDSGGHEEALEELISTGCDVLAIMNYSKMDESGQIQTEMSIADREKKPVIIIYELQKPGEHGLKNVNTYYEDGLHAVKKSVKKLEKVYGKGAFQYALHEYKALQEVIERE